MNELEVNNNLFEKIKHIDEEGNEFWYARELQKALDYKEWRKFEGVINKAKIACNLSGSQQLSNFVQLDKIVKTGVSEKKIIDYKLSRYACYLIAQNGDSHMLKISLAQTYFAIQTRKQELSEQEYNLLSEDDKRLYRRNQVKTGNYNLNKTAVKSIKEIEKERAIMLDLNEN